ncbi:MAG: hypothetical protein AAF602_04200 [Myxococcota bacterium]
MRLKTLMIISLAALPLGVAFGQTMVEEFDQLTTNCGATWSGSCPVGWVGVGPGGTLSTCIVDGDEGVTIAPTTAGPTRLARSGSVGTANYLAFDATLASGTTTGAFVQIRTFDANGTLLDHTRRDVTLAPMQSHVVDVELSMSAGASTYQVAIGSDDDTGEVFASSASVRPHYLNDLDIDCQAMADNRLLSISTDCFHECGGGAMYMGDCEGTADMSMLIGCDITCTGFCPCDLIVAPPSQTYCLGL